MQRSQDLRGGLPWAIGYLLVWGVAVAFRLQSGDAMDAIICGVVFAGVLPPVVWFFTRKARPADIPVARPVIELSAVLAWLAIYAVVVLGWLFTWIKQTLPPQTQTYDVVMLAVKLAVHVAIPIVVLQLVGAKVGPLLAPRMGARGVLPLLIIVGGVFTGLMLVISPSLKEISAIKATATTFAWAAPAAFAWLAVEAGFCEEFLFRAVLQTRLAAFLKSEAGAIVIGALLFALAHVPGLYLRPDTAGDQIAGGLPGILAYTVGVLSPIAILFGLIWSRTRSLGLLVLLHASVDFLPNLLEFMHVWAN